MAVISIVLFQIALVCGLTTIRFNVATGELLSIFIPLVWTAIGTSGLSIIYIFRRRKVQAANGDDADAEVSTRAITICFYILLSTVLFICFSLAYPARHYLKSKIAFEDLALVQSLYDSILISLFGVPCLLAAIIGAWVLALELERVPKE